MKASLEAERQRADELQEEATAARGEVGRLQPQPQPQPPQVPQASADSSGEQRAIAQPLYLATSRKLERFRDRPEKATDLTIEEWMADIKGHLTSRQLKEADQAPFVVDHLVGKARQEVLGRGTAVSMNARTIFEVLTKVFGDGNSLPQLQQRFFAYQQRNEDLLTCSLNLVALYDRIGDHDASFRAGRNTALKGRLAEAVRDEGLQRELRRLNMECPQLSYFEVRDREHLAQENTLIDVQQFIRISAANELEIPYIGYVE